MRAICPTLFGFCFFFSAPSPLSERRYSDIPVHRTPSAENEAILRQTTGTADAWKRTSFSLDQQCATLGRSDSQLLQFGAMTIGDAPSFTFLDDCSDAFSSLQGFAELTGRGSGVGTNMTSRLFPENPALIKPGLITDLLLN